MLRSFRVRLIFRFGFGAIALLPLGGVALAAQGGAQSVRRPNVLFIAMDDLRPNLNCYGQGQMKTPNFDRLATEAVTFQRAYCNVPVCGASRASLLTGLYANRNRFLNYGSRMDKDAPQVPTLPQWFKQHGYQTLALGKISHHPDDSPQSWSQPPWRPDYPHSLAQQEQWRDYQAPENRSARERDLPMGAAGPAWESAEVPDEAYYDGKIAARARAEIDRLAGGTQPFFLGLGFLKPHLPFNAPKKYWDLYRREDIALADNHYWPKDAPAEARHNWEEMRSYTNIPQGRELVPDDTARTLRHGYYACISYLDALLGSILDRLDQRGLADNTLIVLWGDHGWQLGEHTLWCKHSTFANALRAPLIIKAPGVARGARSPTLVQFVDLYPTLCDLAQLAAPPHLQGRSLVPVLRAPAEVVNPYVFSRYNRGEAVADSRYLYTEFMNPAGKVISTMLYDHANDPAENRNIAGQTESKAIVSQLSAALAEHRHSVYRD